MTTTLPTRQITPAARRNDVRPDIARVNLELAVGLPHGVGGEAEVDACLATLDEWAALCAAETRRAKKDFKRDPGYYDHSRATFAMMCVVTVLQRDLGIRYNPDAIGTYSFADARESFLHGLLTGPAAAGRAPISPSSMSRSGEGLATRSTSPSPRATSSPDGNRNTARRSTSRERVSA